MSRWSDDYESHPIHQTLKQSIEWLDTDIEHGDTELEQERSRLRKVLLTLQSILIGIDAEFFPQQIFDQINKHLRHQNFFQQLEAYSTNQDVGYLRVSNDHISAYAGQIFHLAGLTRPEESREVIKKAEDAYESFLSSIKKSLVELENRTSESKDKLSALDSSSKQATKSLEEFKAKVDEQLSEWQSEFMNSETTRNKEHSTAEIERKKEYEELLTEWRSTIQTQLDESASEHKSKLGSAMGQIKKEGEDILTDVREKHKSVLEIHRLVGRDSVAGGYQSSAGEEKEAANRWRIISMVALGAAIVWLGFKYSRGFDSSNTVNWAELLTVSSLTAILLLTAGYASRQSKMHRDNEKQMRSYALETKALDPFMAGLDEDERKKIKAELIRRMFGQQHSQDSSKANKIDDGTLKTLADSISSSVADSIAKIVGKG